MGEESKSRVMRDVLSGRRREVESGQIDTVTKQQRDKEDSKQHQTRQATVLYTEIPQKRSSG